MSGILNLQKNDILDLTKKDPSLNNLVLAAGWDVVKKGFFSFSADFDLDLVALLLNENDKLLNRGKIYFGNQTGAGIQLHGDNRTGEGKGDDERISISLNKLPSNCSKVLFAVTIYDADSRKQNFGKVKNAYVRLLNKDKNEEEVCRYNLTDDGGKSTAIIFASLEKITGDWNFKAVGELVNASVGTISERYK